MNKFSAIDSKSSDCVKHWFKSELYPLMLQCEARVRQNVLKRNPSSREMQSYPDDEYFDDNVSAASDRDDDYLDHNEAEQLRLFLQETSAHQRKMKEIRRKKQEDEPQYVLDTQGPVVRNPPSIFAPAAQPQKSRFDCLQSLYGAQADKIVSLETNLQARFDQTIDSMLPAYWPVIPFKFS